MFDRYNFEKHKHPEVKASDAWKQNCSGGYEKSDTHPKGFTHPFPFNSFIFW